MNRTSLLLLAFCAGCADYDMAAKGAADSAELAPDDSGVADSDDTGADPEPAWYVVRAQLVVLDGAAAPDGASVAIDVVDADLARTDCTVSLDPDGIAPADSASDAAPLWWGVPVAPLAPPCATLPDTLVLGIGALLPDVRAQLGAVSRDDIADSLFGAYIQVDDGEVSTFGYAGTEQDLAGDDAAALPPPDGTYDLAPLYLLALPG